MKKLEPFSLDPNEAFLVGSKVCLKVLTEKDIDNSNWFAWYNDPDSTMFTQHHRFPNTPELQKEYLRKEIAGSSTRIQLGICELMNGPIVGVISLQNINHVNRTAEIAIMIGEKEYRKMVYMIESFRLLIRHGFETLNLNRIFAGTMTDELAELLCRCLGFQREGVFRQHIYKNGKYYDARFVGLLRDEYRADLP